MIRLIRIIAGIIAFSAFVSVYSSPQMRAAIMTSLDSEYEYEDHYYEDDNNYEGDNFEGGYAYDDYDSDY